ncbi:MAG: DUF2335 domain-containing protein [Steroidobacteraceae bacterium]
MATPPREAVKAGETQAVLQSEQWVGPLPPPAALAQFEQIIPGGAERILRMTEQEHAHRLSQEQEGLRADIKDSRRGQWFGAIIAFSAIVGAVVNATLGGPWQASVALVGVPLLGVVQAFIRGRDSGTGE